MIPRACVIIVLLLSLSAAAEFCAGEENPFSAEERSYWAFQPIGRPAPPPVSGAGWVINPIDSFVLAKLEASRIPPAAEADRMTLLRRAVFDLHGLPPTPQQIDRFLADRRPGAFERLVDRLLASPRYGERWARHWLDLVRYAETDGYNQDARRPHAWRYRDYVVEALNADKPYDRFIAEQLAGDELFPGDPAARVATGFLRHWPYEFNQRNVPQQRMHILNDLTDVAGQVFLGLTVGCARCHDHKFDAILQRDYFRLQAFFTPLVPREGPLASPAEIARRRKQLDRWREKSREVRDKLAKLESPLVTKEQQTRKSLFTKEIQAIINKPSGERTPYEQQIALLAEKQLELTDDDVAKLVKGETKKRWQKLRAELEKLKHLRPRELPVAMSVSDLGGRAPPTIIPDYGDADDPETFIAPGFLSVLDPRDANVIPTAGGTGRRSALAQWLTSDRNPLVARVMVNRLWHHHFRRGLVATPEDLGQQGRRPTHPRLLDWLASELMDRGWSLKAMHRFMMTSATYRQTSRVGPTRAASEKDPDNQLLWRMRAGRLEAEVIRDSMLCASGELNGQMHGPSVFPKLPPGISVRHAWKATPEAAQRNRRSIYLFVKRNLLHPLLDSFDMPDPHEPCARRQVTTTAPQALILLNGRWPLERAAAFAARLRREAGEKPSRRELISRAYRLAYSRQAFAGEVESAARFLDRQAASIRRRLEAGGTVVLPLGMDKKASGQAEAAALVDFCHALLNSNEFVYVD